MLIYVYMIAGSKNEGAKKTTNVHDHVTLSRLLDV